MSTRVMKVLGAAALFVGLTLCLPAAAQPPDPELLARLSKHAAAFEDILRRASFTVDAVQEELDRDGKVETRETSQARVESDGKSSREVLISATKNGKDVTAEEREKRRKEEEEEAKKRASGKKSDDGDAAQLHMPFLASQQAFYDFDQIETDAADPSRVKIRFVPKRAAKSLVEGSAWVDTASGTVLSAGVKLSKPPSFVDWVHFTAEFGAKTPLGPTLSHLTFEAKGGLLFLVRKHFPRGGHDEGLPAGAVTSGENSSPTGRLTRRSSPRDGPIVQGDSLSSGTTTYRRGR